MLDTLPDGVVIDGASAAGATVQVQQATNEVTATFNAPITGAAGPDATMVINFHVGETLAPGDPTTPVLDPATGASRALENNVAATADWTPLDPRDDPETFVVDPTGPENVIVAKALAVQKTATILSGSETGIPGDVVEWTVRAQVSDYFDLDALRLSDLLSASLTS